MGVFVRGSKLWIRFRGVSGKWRNVSTGYDVGQEPLAREMLAEMMRLVATESAGEAPIISKAGRLTVREYVERWLKERRALDHDWKHDRSRLEHVLPVLGELAIAEVRARHLIEAFQRVRTVPSEATGEVLSPRSVRRIYETVSRMFGDAQLADMIEHSPCVLDERHLGPLVDKDPEWRAGAVFTRDEATTLISTTTIPDDRRLLYGFMLLAGMRPGEACALRWRHYDPTLQPLGRLTVAVAYDNRRHREKATKTEATRYVPVHPVLAAMLAEWKLYGWEAMIGRQPEPDDLIIPLPPAAAAKRRTREGEPFRTEPYNGKRWREVDELVLGWRHRELYAMKATFITLALEDGADPEIIESRVTHTKKARAAFDGYVRISAPQWAKACAEVAKLQITRIAVAEVVPIAVGGPLPNSRGGSLVTAPVTATASERDGSGVGLRRRVSNGTERGLQVFAGGRSQPLAAAAVPSDALLERAAVTADIENIVDLAKKAAEERRIRKPRNDNGKSSKLDVTDTSAPVRKSKHAAASADLIADELELAAGAWRAAGDRTELRRRLVRLLVKLEGE